MKKTFNTEKFRMYGLKGQEERIAVPREYWPNLDYEISQHDKLENVPSERSVSGIFFKETEGEWILDETAQKNDFVINQLIQFEAP